MLWRRLGRARRVVQAIVFVLWLALLFVALQRRSAFPAADLFFRLDPLIALSTVLAGKVWVGRTALALATVALTVVLGRVWCGWICPLGTLLEWIGSKRARRRARRLPPRLGQVKYLLLAAIVAAALLGNLTLLVLDPLALLARATGTAVIPALNWAVIEAEDGLYEVGFGQSAVDVFETVVRGRLLPTIQPAFQQALPAFALLLTVVLLNLLADRFWCRYLCPLGALLGLIAKVSVLRPYVEPSCSRCRSAAGVCRQGAIAVAEPAVAVAGSPHAAHGHDGEPPGPAQPPAVVVSSECVMCLDCLVVLGDDGMSFGVHPRPAPAQAVDPGRRRFLAALAAGAGGVMLLGAGVWNARASSALIRPPGVTDEDVFLASCVRCSQCMRVCPTSGLQPAATEAGVAGVWTPVLVSRLGYCDFGCNACGQACPVAAIPALPLAEKRRAVLGLAAIDRDRCLPWAYETPCIVCQEVCPLADKAIRLDVTTVTRDGDGEESLQRPYVVRDLCIGCGLCEYHCPVAGTAAVKVYR